MPPWLLTGAGPLGVAAAKVALMFLAALLGCGWRTDALAPWTAIDVAAALAVGANVGRTAVAPGEPLLVGVVALVTVLLTTSSVRSSSRIA
jgi:hypothetical protein